MRSGCHLGAAEAVNQTFHNNWVGQISVTINTRGLSIGIQSGPLIGVRKGPLWRDGSWPEAA